MFEATHAKGMFVLVAQIARIRQLFVEVNQLDDPTIHIDGWTDQ